MEKTAILIGAGDAAGQKIHSDLLKRGWRVLPIYLAEMPDKVDALNPVSDESVQRAAQALIAREDKADLLILNIDREEAAKDATILDTLADEALIADYEYLCVGVVRALAAFMPMLEVGEGKRICLVTTPEGSQSLCKADSGYGRRMAKASLNMAMKLLFNELRPEGYTFRIYCKDQTQGEYAAELFTRDRSLEPENPPHSDENRLVLHDSFGGELPW